MWKDKLREIEKIKNIYGEQINVGALEKELNIFSESMKNECNMNLPEEYLNFLGFIKALLYDYSNSEVQKLIPKIDDSKELHIYAYNYNWDNGFDIPEEIMKNKECTLSTALLLFYRADGERYLLEKSNIIPSDWSEFMIKLYSSIMNGKYRVDGIGFKAPLSRVQLLKMKKELDKNENILLKK